MPAKSLPGEEFKCLPASLSLLPHALTRRYTSGHASAAAARTNWRCSHALLQGCSSFLLLFFFYVSIQTERLRFYRQKFHAVYMILKRDDVQDRYHR